MDRSFTVLFSFVRHNRYEAVENMLQQDLELLQVSHISRGPGCPRLSA